MTSKSPDVASAIRRYAALARRILGDDESAAVSYAGLWLLLASLAPAVTDAAEFRRVCGLSPVDAKDAATQLLDEPHPTVASALGAWLAQNVALRGELPVALEQLPSQPALDEWARQETRDVLDAFPLEIDAQTMLVLASALVLTPRWSGRISYDEYDDMLILHDGMQAVVETSVGPVAIARPATDDGVDVISVIASPEVRPAEMWNVVDEVVEMFDDGTLLNNTFPAAMRPAEIEEGHSWTSVKSERLFWGDAPEEGSEVWEARLPEWSVTQTTDLATAPGVGLIAAPIQAMLPEESDVSCVQNVSATYDEDGFSAAAVTVLAVAGSAPPTVESRTTRQVTLTFDRPHAVVAVARGGAWDGIPLFHAWVDPKERTIHE